MENNNLQQWAQKTALEKAPSLINELEAASERMTRASDDAKHLGNLLAVIHGDGGHYQDEHGTAKAVADAEAKVVQWLASDDAKAARLLGALEAITDMTYDSWTNGAVAGEIAIAAVAASKGQK